MEYCANGSDFNKIWYGDGINRCFLNTITSGLLLLFMVICGCIQCAVFRKYATKTPQKYTKSNLFTALQTFLTVILMIESVAHIITEDLTKENAASITGVELLTFLCLFFAWGGSLRLLVRGRKQMLRGISSRGLRLVLLIFWTLAFLRENLAFISWWSHSWWWYLESTHDRVDFGFWLTRYLLTAVLFLIGLKEAVLPYSEVKYRDEEGKAESGGSLLKPETGTSKAQKSTWSNVFKKLKMMAPYVWPKGSLWRQLIVLACLIILGAGRGINLLVPLYSKYIVNSLTYTSKEAVNSEQEATVYSEPGAGDTVNNDLGVTGPEFRWDYILIYSFLLFLKGCGGGGGTGFLNNARSFLWIPVQQYTTRRIQVKLFEHLHSLSLSWHLKRKTGEVLRVVDRGTNSINNLLNNVIFQILPTIVDIVIAIVYFITAFNYIFGLVMFLAMAMYLAFTFYITEWRTQFRRDMNRLDNETNDKAVDSLLNFETVKYYGASDFEANRYNEAILKYQSSEWKATASLNLLNTCQNTVISAGILAGSLLCAYAVVYHVNGLNLTVGDYVLFGTYVVQLYGPLNFFGTYYRMIQQAFIDMENMFELLDVDQEVKDVPDAKELVIKSGEIEFNKVTFRYEPSKPILKSINFTVPAGQTYALVGHSGSGKSTLIRLLFRFYDVESGTIKIDGQDISQVKQESLRKCIGVVPQDTVLFNNDIRYNVRYGRVTASDQEVEEATDAADVHTRILTFPSKYETVVGERGLKLSGGEKQRVAIARTLLKSPAIVLLDEFKVREVGKKFRELLTVLASGHLSYKTCGHVYSSYVPSAMLHASETRPLTKANVQGLRPNDRAMIRQTCSIKPEDVATATSALDTKTERNIQSSLARVCENRTTIIVAHRLSTIIHANMILVMDEGEIVERGTHEELLALNGSYCDMWQQQLTKLEETEDKNGSASETTEVTIEHNGHIP